MRFQQTLQLEKHRAEQEGRREEIDRLFGPVRADIHQVYCINKAWHDPLTMSLMRIQSLVKDHLAQRAMAHSINNQNHTIGHSSNSNNGSYNSHGRNGGVFAVSSLIPAHDGHVRSDLQAIPDTTNNNSGFTTTNTIPNMPSPYRHLLYTFVAA
ncbi:hypothetical protein BSLG_003692 [Batrachochytrium salamandrivorans]|nr:hypothetical protein BSLG_003692 [Batrachochytrium salamandrivorans]